MKNISKQHFVLTTICLLGFIPMLYSQNAYTIHDSESNAMKLSGTSTFHKWDMDSKIFSGNAQFGLNDNLLTSLKSLTFSLVVQNLKSGEKGLDKNAYKALKTDQFKNIDYKLISAIVSPIKDKKYLVKTHGSLTVAGITKEVDMDVYCVINDNQTITCTGTDKLKMSDYKVKPPTFMLGAMKTGDDLTLNFTMVYEK